MGILLLKLILSYTLLFKAVIFVCLGGSNETDRLALLAIKAQINEDPHHFMSSWTKSTHFCMWQGVTCSQRHHQRVTRLKLPDQNLIGSLSPHVGNLSFLRGLHLQNNSFSHQIPPEITNLLKLQVLILRDNLFTGQIPSNLSYCFSLLILDLSGNSLTGKIPPEIGSLSKLQYLSLQTNNLSGGIPPSLGNLSSVERLGAGDNNLMGTIPSSLGLLKNLTRLSLAINSLSGTIPSSIYNLSSLQLIEIVYNQIQGTIPSDLGTTLPNLQVFNIAENQFTGSIPLSISNATSVIRFLINGNKLHGLVPDLRKLHKLQFLDIYDNHLGNGKDGDDLSFVSDLRNATELTWLLISGNNFGGALPTSISNLSATKLQRFWLHNNQLRGSIPVGIGNLINLDSLSMGNNGFTNSIPAEIGKLSRLVELGISENKLSGNIPSSLGNLTKLSRLFLHINNLRGIVPSSLGECQHLQLLDLSYNNLSGTIPPQVVGLSSFSMFLNFSSNQFRGSLPMEIGALKSLGELDISDNKLSGELPSSLGSCSSLEVLHLQGNCFNGSIPSSMSALRGIRDMDVSRNKLSGEIPLFLQDLVFFRSLNLSFNDFWGAVPVEGVFKNATSSSVVGNNGLCGGVANLQLPKCKKQGSSSSPSSHRLMKLIFSLVFGFALLGIIAFILSYLFLCSSRKKRKEISLSTTNFLPLLSYTTIQKATNGFSSANLIGVGSFGSVYKGVLDDGGDELVAVKVFNLLRHGASKSFVAECEALRNIRHRNLVKIITACSSVDFHGNDFKALVYEFMSNGSLEEWLHPINGTEDVEDQTPKNLNLLQRLCIAIDVACALDYLHNHCETPIVHCDLKPSNVLLDNELMGHVSDFGLARFLSQLTSNDVSANQTRSSIGIRGTVGYAAPEYGMGSEVSTNGDVYSFGILLLEMFTGKRPTSDMFGADLNLHNYVKMALFADRVNEIADSTLLRRCSSDDDSPNRSNARDQKIEVCLNSIFRTGIACSHESPTDRVKNMSDVVSELHSIRNDFVA